MKTTPVVKIWFEDELVEASQGQTLLEALVAADCAIDHSCGGNASCGTCRVICQQPELLADREPLEKEFAEDRQLGPRERLSCQLVCEPRWASLQLQFRKPPGNIKN